MKILAISDIHGKKSDKLIDYLKKEDILVNPTPMGGNLIFCISQNNY